MGKKVVVFGGSGFLGSHVSDQLSIAGFEVSIFDISPSKFINKNQKMVIGDITNYEDVNKIISQVDIVYHFAAIADIKEADENPINAIKYNIIGTTNILEACKNNKIERLVFSSSVYVYSEHGSIYRITKQTCELLIENFNEKYNLKYTILRYGSLYGPRANKFNFIYNAINQALVENKITRKGDCSEIRDYIHVIDAAILSVEILNSKFENEYIMITGNQSIKVSRLLEMIKEILKNKIEICYLSGKMDGHYKITPYSFRPNVAKKLIPRSFHDLGQGILDCIYEQNSILKNKL